MRHFRFTMAALGFPQSLLMPSVAALGMLWLWTRASAVGWLDGLILMAAGLCAWTLLEYLLHRLMLHRVGLELVARDGQIRWERIWTCAACPQGEDQEWSESIEPSTRGLSVRRRPRFGASKSTTGKAFLPGRPNR